MFDDPARERGRLGSIIAGMGDRTGKPTERVANPCLVTDAAEPNAITPRKPMISGVGPKGGVTLTRDEDTRALDERRTLSGGRFEELESLALVRIGQFGPGASTPDEAKASMSVLSRSDLVLKIMPDRKMCASCPRGSRLQFAYGHWLKWRRCRRHLTIDEKAVLALKLMEAEAGGLTD